VPSPDEHLARVEQLLGGRITDGVELRLRWSSPVEAKRHLKRIGLIQRQLRLIKKEVGADARQARIIYANERARVGTGLGAFLTIALAGRRTAGRVNAARRQGMRIDQLEAQAPYETLRTAIDAVLAQLEQVKIQIEAALLGDPPSAVPNAPPTDGRPGAPDPAPPQVPTTSRALPSGGAVAMSRWAWHCSACGERNEPGPLLCRACRTPNAPTDR
jgi:hypothetical protein